MDINAICSVCIDVTISSSSAYRKPFQQRMDNHFVAFGEMEKGIIL